MGISVAVKLQIVVFFLVVLSARSVVHLVQIVVGGVGLFGVGRRGFLLALESGVVERVAERSSRARQFHPSFVGFPSRHVDAHRRARRIELVGVWVPRCRKVEVEVFHETQRERRVDVAPAQRVGCKVVRLRYREVLDEGYLLHASAVLVAFHFHFHVV